MLIGIYCGSSLCLWMTNYARGDAAACWARCTLIDCLIVSKALNFPSDGHFLTAATWDIIHSRIYNGRAHRTTQANMHICSAVRCYDQRTFAFHSLWFLWPLTCCRCAVFQYRMNRLYVWSRCCMLGSKQTRLIDKFVFPVQRKGRGNTGLMHPFISSDIIIYDFLLYPFFCSYVKLTLNLTHTKKC